MDVYLLGYPPKLLCENKLANIAEMFLLGWALGCGWICLKVEEDVVGLRGRTSEGVYESIIFYCFIGWFGLWRIRGFDNYICQTPSL